jgi:hypothetical protein
MRLAKQNIYRAKFGDKENSEDITSQIRRLNDDLTKVYEAFKGRIDFGTGVDGENGVNIAGQFQEFTTSATPDAENTIAHTVGSIPIGVIIMHQDKAGSLYQGPTTGTNWTATNVYLKCDVASVTFNVFLIKKGGGTI